MRSLPGCLACGFAALLLAACPAAAAAQPVDDNSAVCSGEATVTFSQVLSAVTSTGPVGVTISSTPLACAGAVTTAASIDGSGVDMLGASCESVAVVLGSGGITLNGSTRHAATWFAEGTATDQLWQWVDASESAPGVQGFAAAAWTASGPGPDSCATKGLSSVTLSVVLVIVA